MPATKTKVAKPATQRIPTTMAHNSFQRISTAQAATSSNDLPETQDSSRTNPVSKDLHSLPNLPDYLLEMPNQLRRHEAKFQELETLVTENSRLREGLAAAEARIRVLEKGSSPPSGAPPSPSLVMGEPARPSSSRPPPPRLPRPARVTPAARDAAARTFQPVSETQGFSFVYLPCRSKEPISNMREKLRKLKLQSSHLLDIHYPTNNIMSILVHNDYLEETTRLLQLQKIDLLQDFEPTSSTLLRDPKFDDATETQRVVVMILNKEENKKVL
ncbi:hypothetical protein A0J61_11286 [Choanephora cucurbitarum]|uniref:Uncharacterized protein n=1 Tax=Choanephora cucurbitarum TaxID=101091 RepID=A0A1C7MUV2_9FUNG|nr:hypothetical protein A0J61_11286 [Choanephora cucurbitarum]